MQSFQILLHDFVGPFNRLHAPIYDFWKLITESQSELFRNEGEPDPVTPETNLFYKGFKA